MTDASPPPSGRNPFNIWWALSGGLLLLVVIAAVIFGVTAIAPPAAEPGDETTAPTAPATSAPQPTTDPTADVCNVDATDQSIPVAGPAAEWETFGYFLYPTSSTYGPIPDPAGSEWGCFAQSPTGALFAAANFFRVTAGDDFETGVPQAAVDNAALDAWLATARERPSGQTAGRVAQISGFQYMSVEPDAVSIRLLFTQDDLDAYLTLGMVWDEDRQTWIGDFGASEVAPTVAESVTTFTPWAAVANG
ncbi:hypothetical protein [Microbacterium aurantiacum]|uniref:DUF8175 domain-containing protein n=1 Tax=Microbacterium aurantiacum TaxID=162393 RepID=A0AAJ2M112_9MICO|nr:hypothetical protein [Microbacterium aurantiacum]MDS0246999.1 hypothetical protein [Microbacterium aurantiacum]